MISLRDRLLAKAVINWETGCWEWIAGRDHAGYGRITVVGGKRGIRAAAYRVSYEMTYGPIPQGLTIDHLCRVRCCINPAHLEAVTMAVNTLRGIGPSALNAAKTHCPQNHEYAPENTYVTPTGARHCRTCRHIRGAATYQARKAAVQ